MNAFGDLPLTPKGQFTKTVRLSTPSRSSASPLIPHGFPVSTTKMSGREEAAPRMTGLNGTKGEKSLPGTWSFSSKPKSATARESFSREVSRSAEAPGSVGPRCFPQSKRPKPPRIRKRRTAARTQPTTIFSQFSLKWRWRWSPFVTLVLSRVRALQYASARLCTVCPLVFLRIQRAWRPSSLTLWP